VNLATPSIKSVRKATLDDIPTIRRLANESWWATYPPIIGAKQVAYMLKLIYSPEALTEQMEAGHTFLLALDNDSPVGFASYSLIADRTYKLHKLYILPGQQGKGVGKFLVDFIFDAISKDKAAALELNVNRNNPAKSFYVRLGFVVVRQEDIDIGSGFWMNDYVMRKEISMSRF
jgi:ribosomal protein S18 acetylase RimI-like enzyme